MNRHRPAFVCILALILAALLAGVGGPASAQDPNPTRTPAALPTSIEQYGLFEIAVPVERQYADPSNSQQVELTARFRAPDGAQVNVPGFWMQPQQQTCSQGCSIEVIRPVGDARWMVRFSPDRIGEWRYQVELRDSESVRAVSQGRFVVTPSRRPGFIRPRGRYFAHDSGASFFPVGSNLGWSWSGARNTPGYQDWLRQLSAAGANYARLYIDVPWFIGLGWRSPASGAAAFQEDAWRLDTLLRTAEEQGIALQLVLLWHQGWITFGGLPVNVPSSPPRPNTDADWFANPYNVQRGGPFATATQFFASEEGRRLFRDRLRYIVARWGYSGSVFAWELIDQFDRVMPNNPEMAQLWLREMVNYLRQIDPYRHPITAGVRDPRQIGLLDAARLDFWQARYFQRRPIEQAGDQVLGLLDLLTPVLTNADRPALISEFSLNPWFEPTTDDPEGIHVLTTMWASALAGAAGAASPWWWDTYLFPQNLVPSLGPLAAFTRPIPWASSELQPTTVSLTARERIVYQPLRIAGYAANFGQTTPPDQVYRVTPDGIYPPIGTASAFLYGVTFNAQLSRPHEYIIAPPIDTRLKINVVRVSERAPARLVVIIDGDIVGEVALSPRSLPTSLIVPLRAGEHRVVIDNLGEDFLQIDSLEIADYISPLRVLALADREAGMLLAWAQHRDYTWQNTRRSTALTTPIPPIAPVTAALGVSAMPVGLYRVEFWDPQSGNVIGQEEIMVEADGAFTVDLLPVSSMLALRAIRVAEPASLPSATPTATSTPRIAPSATPTPTVTPTPSPTPPPPSPPTASPTRASPTPPSPTPNVVG